MTCWPLSWRLPSVSAAVAQIDTFHNAALNPTSGEFLMPIIGVLDDPFA